MILEKKEQQTPLGKAEAEMTRLATDCRKAMEEDPNKAEFLAREFADRCKNDISLVNLTKAEKSDFVAKMNKTIDDMMKTAKTHTDKKLKDNLDRGNKMEKKVMEAVEEVGKTRGQDVPMGCGKAGDMCDCVHAEVDVAFADAVNQDKENREKMGKMWKDMEKDAKDITPKDPESPMKEKNMFTEKLTLDESLFEAVEDEPKKAFGKNARKKLGESSKRDDIDAKRDNRVERARARFNKVRDDADAQRDDRLKKHGLKESKRPLKEEVSDEAYQVADMIADRFDGRNGVSWNKFDQALEDGILDVFGEEAANALTDVESKLPTGDTLFDFEQDVRGILGYRGWETIWEGPNEGGIQKTVIPKTDDQLIHLALSRLTDHVSDLDLTEDELDRLNDLMWEYEEKANKETVYEACGKQGHGRARKLKEEVIANAKSQDLNLVARQVDKALERKGIKAKVVTDDRYPGEVIIFVSGDEARDQLKAIMPDVFKALQIQAGASEDINSKKSAARGVAYGQLNHVQAQAVAEGCKARKSRSKKLTEAPVYGLTPQYDARQSFYGKAQVDTGDKGDKNKLYSYDTLVAEMKDGKPVVYGTFSATTLRHIKEWLKQNGFKAENAKQIMADYGEKK